MPDIIIYTTKSCSYCDRAKRLLSSRHLKFQEIPLDENPQLRIKLSEENQGYRTVPMIFINGVFLGGYTDLEQRMQVDGSF